jgi:hypothetical protein
MHLAWAEDLATRHAADLQAAAATRRRRAVAAGALTAVNTGGEPAPSITQRAGWALVQVGLRLALHQSA